MEMKKILGILLAVCFLMSVTVAAVSAGTVEKVGYKNGKGKRMDEEHKKKNATGKRETKIGSGKKTTIERREKSKKDIMRRRDTSTVVTLNTKKWVTKSSGITMVTER